MISAGCMVIRAADLDDMKWFAEHSQRSHRFRPLLPGEHAALSRNHKLPLGTNWKLIRQLAPYSVIQWWAIGVDEANAVVAAEDEHQCAAIFDVLDATDGACGVTVEQVKARASMYERAAAGRLQ
jgi:hypothetical protein